MIWWVFHEEQLDAALAKRAAERQAKGVSEQQAKEENAQIKAFLIVYAAQVGGRAS